MCVVDHGYGGLGGDRDGGGGWYSCRTKPGGGRISVDDDALPEYEVIP